MTGTTDRLMREFQRTFYPSGFPAGYDEDDFLREFEAWCMRTVPPGVIRQMNDEARKAVTQELFEALLDGLVDQGKARCLLAPQADGTLKKVWDVWQPGEPGIAEDPEQN